MNHAPGIRLQDYIAFLFSSLNSGSSLISISSAVLELWKLLYVTNFTRYLEIEKISVWNLSNIWELELLRDTKCNIGVPND